MHATIHPFQHRKSSRNTIERVVFLGFRAATYLVLLCAAAIFLDIAFKGTRALVQPKFPYVNTDFFTKSPETLYVFDYKGQHREMGDAEFRAFKASEKVDDIPAANYVYSAGGIFPCIVGTIL